MQNLLSIADIRSQFDSEWVLVENPVTNAQLEVEQGTVVAHSPNRDDVCRQANELHPARFAIIYTGVAPANTAIVL